MIVILDSLFEFVPTLMQAAGREYSCDVKPFYRNRQCWVCVCWKIQIHLCIGVGKHVPLPQLDISAATLLERLMVHFYEVTYLT